MRPLKTPKKGPPLVKNKKLFPVIFLEGFPNQTGQELIKRQSLQNIEILRKGLQVKIVELKCLCHISKIT